ncbi:MAG: hypothetical protein CMP60_00045 [Flavobacteriales bacterium]|nr:hypothetical protein [Flavobacteriales bacterium]
MKRFRVLILCFSFLNVFSQDKKITNFNSKIIQSNYTFQVPINELVTDFGTNSALGLAYLNNQNDFLLGLDINFMFGNNVKNDSLLQTISTEEGWLINTSGELETILHYERGWNSHILFGKSFRYDEKHLTGVYVYVGIGYLQHKIRLENNRTDLPQIDKDYIKGYDKFTNGISTKLCVEYMYFSKENSVKFNIGIELINAFTKNRRPYDFAAMEEYDNNLRIDQLIGIKFGIIIPINRNNEQKFHYY